MAAEGELFQIGEVAKLYHESVGSLRHYGAGGAAGTGICRTHPQANKESGCQAYSGFLLRKSRHCGTMKPF